MKYAQVVEAAERMAAADIEVESLLMMNVSDKLDDRIKAYARLTMAREKARRARADYDERLRLFYETPESER